MVAQTYIKYYTDTMHALKERKFHPHANHLKLTYNQSYVSQIITSPFQNTNPVHKYFLKVGVVVMRAYCINVLIFLLEKFHSNSYEEFLKLMNTLEINAL